MTYVFICHKNTRIPFITMTAEGRAYTGGIVWLRVMAKYDKIYRCVRVSGVHNVSRSTRCQSAELLAIRVALGSLNYNLYGPLMANQEVNGTSQPTQWLGLYHQRGRKRIRECACSTKGFSERTFRRKDRLCRIIHLVQN